MPLEMSVLRERALQVERLSAEKGDMAPILKRLLKPSETESPDLATLLEPYGTPEAEGEDAPADAQDEDA
jgi:hypothetical protein